MEKVSLHRKHRILVATVLASIGLALGGPATAAQQPPINWKAPMATITVTAAPSAVSLRELQRLTVFGSKFLVVSASVPVPYADLNLKQESGATELGRRINLAARMACEQLDIKYPQNIYPVMGTDDCEKKAADGGKTEAGTVIASARR